MFSLLASRDPGEAGNHIHARQGATGRWSSVYLGQGDLAERSGPGHHNAGYIRLKAATHFHCHLNADPGERLTEEADPLAANLQVYESGGCNER